MPECVKKSKIKDFLRKVDKRNESEDKKQGHAREEEKEEEKKEHKFLRRIFLRNVDRILVLSRFILQVNIWILLFCSLYFISVSFSLFFSGHLL